MQRKCSSEISANFHYNPRHSSFYAVFTETTEPGQGMFLSTDAQNPHYSRIGESLPPICEVLRFVTDSCWWL